MEIETRKTLLKHLGRKLQTRCLQLKLLMGFKAQQH
jgi:hypothetical protein